jgi:hypothetical protein
LREIVTAQQVRNSAQENGVGELDIVGDVLFEEIDDELGEVAVF